MQNNPKLSSVLSKLLTFRLIVFKITKRTGVGYMKILKYCIFVEKIAILTIIVTESCNFQKVIQLTYSINIVSYIL